MAVFIGFMSASGSHRKGHVGLHHNFSAASATPAVATRTLGPFGLNSKHGLSEPEMREDMVGVTGAQSGFFGAHM